MPNDTRLNYRNISKFYLLLCELHNPKIHGYSNIYSDPNIYTHYIVVERFDGPTKMSLYDLYDELEYNTDIEYDSEDTELGVDTIHNSQLKNIYQTAKYYNKIYRERVERNNSIHPSIRNYKNIVLKQNYIKPEIAEYIILPTQEAIAILKTYLIRIIQRAWKRVFQIRKEILRKRCCPGAISTFQLTGNWPEHCKIIPGLKGLLVK